MSSNVTGKDPRFPVRREAHWFPTRQFPYRSLSAEEMRAAAQAEDMKLPPGQICRFIMGRDQHPEVMTSQEIAGNLNDAFATLLLRRGVLPLTARTLIADLDKHDAEPQGLPVKKSFLVADGGQIQWSPQTANLNRQLRMVLLRGRNNQLELLVSCSTVFDSESLFLQVFSWDPNSEAFNFYERRNGAWCWAGSSWDALANDSRGNGPFDSHVNGAPVMKELKAPWMNWHSMAAAIPDEVLEPSDTLREDPLFRDKSGAEELETFVRSGIKRWTKSRFKRSLSDARLVHPSQFLRQVLTSTTVNLITSPDESRALRPGDQLRLPRTFFLNTEALLNLLSLPITFPLPQTDVAHYFACLHKYEVQVRDEKFSFPGDTHFAFVVPEPAFEDLVILEELLARGIISRRFAAALCLTDFPNPVFSDRRANLLPYVPEELPPDGTTLEQLFISNVRNSVSTTAANSAEHEFLGWIDVPDGNWAADVGVRIDAYLKAVESQLASAEGFDAFFRLAESRRREFRRRPLAEFKLTTPSSNIPEDAPALRMTLIASVEPKP